MESSAALTLNPDDARAWQNAVLDEVFAGIAANSYLTDILVFKGARVLARHLPHSPRQSLDIDANCSRDFLANYPERSSQADILRNHLRSAIIRQFERATPVRFRLDDIKVTPRPPRNHPRGWNAFEVRIRLTDAQRPGLRSAPTLEIDIAHEEQLSPDSIISMEVGGSSIRAYALHRIAGEKVRAFLSSLPEYQEKTGRSGGIARAKDLYDLARIVEFRPLSDTLFWEKSALEFQAACISRYVDCDGWQTFASHREPVKSIYVREPTIPTDVDFDRAWQTLEKIVSAFQAHISLPIRNPLPPL